jgi:O-methyltransferase
MVRMHGDDAPAVTESAEACIPPEELYLNLLRKCLTGYLERGILRPVRPHHSRKLRAASYTLLKRVLDRQRLLLARQAPSDQTYAIEGGPWVNQHTHAETMIGMNRLEQLRQAIVDVIQNRVEGDLVETGVWRGGATIFMRAVLRAYGDTARVVWVADSFAGLPQPDLVQYPQDAGSSFHLQDHMRVSLEEVKANFAKYDLLDRQVRFLPGWFRDTLSSAPIERLSVMRLDADMYESTIESLVPTHLPGWSAWRGGLDRRIGTSALSSHVG